MTREQARKILGVGIIATEAEIKNAFRKAAKKYHPDVSTQEGNDQNFIDAHQAFEILMNKQKAESSKTYTNNENKFRNQQHYSKESKKSSAYSYENFEARKKTAWQTAQELEEQMSQRIYHSLFDEYMNGKKRKILKVFAAFFMIIFVFFSFDRLGPSKITKIDKSQYQIFIFQTQTGFDKVFLYNHQRFHFYNLPQQLSENKSDVLIVEETMFFEDIISIKTLDGTEVDYNRDILFLNLYSAFPLYHLIFLVPFLAFFFEKPVFNFLFFGVYGSLYAVPFYFILILLHDNRLLRLLGI